MISPLLRRASIFGAVAGLGFTLAWLLGAAEGRPGKAKPLVPVKPLPPGTSLQAQGGVGGISLVRAENLVVAPVQEAVLEDGTRLPFRAMVLRGDAERPLPSPREEYSRVLITNPDLQLLPVPRTRKEYDASSEVEPSRVRAPEGVLDSGPNDAMILHWRGGVKARTVSDGTPWDFEGEEAVSDVRARTLHAPGAVALVSRDLRVEGRDLDASETARTVTLAGGASGSVESARGVRIAGGEAKGATRFKCRGTFRILPLPAAPAAAAGFERWRLVLDEDAVVDQDDGSLAARHIEADVTRPKAGAKGDTSVDEVRADGAVVLTGRGEGREFRGTGDRLVARPQAKGNTDAWLDGSPAVFVRETDGGREVRNLEIRGEGTARLGFPAADGPVAAAFRGGARAVLLEPPAKEGDPPRRRDLRSNSLSLAGMRSGSGPTRVDAVLAEGEAFLQDGDRTAQAKRIEFHPLAAGASRTLLDGDVLFSWPAAGALDPVSALAPAGDGASPAGPPGTMLLSSPGKAVLEQPAEGSTEEGKRFTVEGGAVLRRVAGEREVYRLACTAIDGRTAPGRGGLERLVAKGDVRLAGREEGPGGRRYEMKGDLLDVRGAPDSREARTADVTGPKERPASASFAREDGSPFTVAAPVLHFDRSDGSFRAEGGVRGTGILPEGRTPGNRGTGAAELSCDRLDGVLARGAGEGSTRVVSLDARGPVWIRTATEYVSGDRLDYDEAKGSLRLRGDPARVTSRTRGTDPARKLEDSCEAPELLLFLKDGALVEARADTGGRIVCHRANAGSTDRFESRCTGPLSYRPEETRLQGEVSVLHSEMKAGAFAPKDRIEGADEVRLYRPLVSSQAGPPERVIASSEAGRIALAFESGEFRASGVARADMDVPGQKVTLESSPGAPRFRIQTADSTGTCRRAIYDYGRTRLLETVAMTLESGK